MDKQVDHILKDEAVLFLISKNKTGDYYIRIDDHEKDEFFDGLALAIQETAYYLLQRGLSPESAVKTIAQIARIGTEAWQKDLCDQKHSSIKWIGVNEETPPVGVDVLGRNRGFVATQRMSSDKKWFLKKGDGSYSLLHPDCFPTQWASGGSSNVI